MNIKYQNTVTVLKTGSANYEPCSHAVVSKL